MRRVKLERPERLEGAAMNYAPVNELGVVLLFAQVAKRYRLRIDQIQAAFPDCIAYQTVGGKERQVRIEFEFRSRSFAAHRHDPRKCDMIVCWQDNWPQCPASIRVLELQREFGHGFNVWINPVGGKYKEELSRQNYSRGWTVPSGARKGDLILFYRNSPDQCIADVFRISTPVRWEKTGLTKKQIAGVRRGWKAQADYFADIRRVGRLRAPVFYDDLKRHRVLASAGFVRAAKCSAAST